MKFIILVDNGPDEKNNLISEHGLCIYFEFNGLKWLFDLGNSNTFIYNATQKGIDISDIDYVFISHGHKDHNGGLQSFLKLNTKAKIYLSQSVLAKNFYSVKNNIKRDLSIDQKLVQENFDRFILINRNRKLAGNAYTIADIPPLYAMPHANQRLRISTGYTDNKDNFDHEIILTLETRGELIVLSGCSHNGILNILNACARYHMNSPLIACIGGTHLVDGFEKTEEITAIGKKIKQQFPVMKLYTGHCTGSLAKEKLGEVLAGNFKTFHTGFEISI